MCESVAIVDRGRLVGGRPVARPQARQRTPVDPARPRRRRTGTRMAGRARRRGDRPARLGRRGARASNRARPRPRSWPPCSGGASPSVASRSIEPSLEALFIELVGRPAEDEIGAAVPGRPRRRRPQAGRPDGTTRSAPPERGDHRPPRVPRPPARTALRRVDHRADGPGPARRDRTDRDPLLRPADGHPDRR